MKAMMTELFAGCMRGRTMYVIPYCMGPLDAESPLLGVELTDSPYVVASMHIMTRMGAEALALLGDDADFVPGCTASARRSSRGRAGRGLAVQLDRSTSRTSPRSG